MMRERKVRERRKAFGDMGMLLIICLSFPQNSMVMFRYLTVV